MWIQGTKVNRKGLGEGEFKRIFWARNQGIDPKSKSVALASFCWVPNLHIQQPLVTWICLKYLNFNMSKIDFTPCSFFLFLEGIVLLHWPKLPHPVSYKFCCFYLNNFIAVSFSLPYLVLVMAQLISLLSFLPSSSVFHTPSSHLSNYLVRAIWIYLFNYMRAIW